MSVLAAFLLINAQAAQEPVLDSPPLDWATDHAPFGMDITFDGKVWINTNKVGARDDYAILANDLYKAITASSSYPRLWVRGYHIRNKGVSYRETKQLIWIDCKADTIRIERRLFYSSTGDVIASEGPFRAEPVVPGSMGESWRKAACVAGQ
jgi:nitrous oxidase accessory protein NosD